MANNKQAARHSKYDQPQIYEADKNQSLNNI